MVPLTPFPRAFFVYYFEKDDNSRLAILPASTVRARAVAVATQLGECCSLMPIEMVAVRWFTRAIMPKG